MLLPIPLLSLPLLTTSLSIFLPLTIPPQSPLLTIPATCDCTNTNNTGPAGKPYICRDPRLGPRLLPKKFPLLSFVSDYDRFAGQKPGQFLAAWTDPATGWYRYPPENGFALDQEGRAILGNMTLGKGVRVDRFGSEYGEYLSAANAPYNQRALPPSSLDSPPDGDYPYNYHVYKVAKPLVVEGGPIAPWFGQSGLGAQFYIGATGNVLEMLDQGYLTRVNASEVEPGPGQGNRGCGL